jgi:hypothetical protein
MKNNENYLMLIVHHSTDMDGLISGAFALQAMKILRSEFRLNVKVVGYNYGKDTKVDEWLDTNQVRYDHYQFIDVTPPLEWIEKVSDSILTDTYGDNSGWNPMIELFDHHKGVYDKIVESDRCLALMGLDYGDRLAMQYYYSPNECGALIYLNSLTSNKFWLDNLVSRLTNEESINKAIRQIFPIKYGKKQVRKQLDMWLTNKEVFDLAKIVSKFDTWAWYAEWIEAGSVGSENSPWVMRPLALNEWFWGLDRDCFNADWVNQQLFGTNCGDWLPSNIYRPNYEKMVSYGFSQIARKVKEAKNKMYSFAYFDGMVSVITAGSISFYESEYIRSLRGNAPKEGTESIQWAIDNSLVLVSYKLDLTKWVCKYSFREIGANFDCASLAAKVGKDNGGGHFGAAGCRTTVDEFYGLVKQIPQKQ